MERERVPLHDMAKLIEYLTHEPLTRATTVAAMATEFDTVTDNLQTLLRLHDELQHKGFSVRGIRYLIHFLVEGAVTRADIGPESNLSKSPACMLKHRQ